MEILLSLLVAILPTIGYALLIWFMDRYEKEPWPLLAVTFVWGAVPAVILALILEAIFGWSMSALSLTGTRLFTGTIVAPLVEESVKALALVGLYLFLRSEFDDVLDGIIYGALVGMGFGMTENLVYFLRSFAQGGWDEWAATVFVRSVIFGLNHAFYSSLFGASLGYARLARMPKKRLGAPILGLAAAMLAHAFHNTALAACGGVLLAIFADWSGILTILVLAILALKREASWITTELAEEVSLGTLSSEDYATLSSLGGRLKAYRQKGREGGWHKMREWRRLAQQATELAFKKYQLRQRGEDAATLAAITRLRTRIPALRAELGQTASPPLVCQSCGHTLRPDSKFCTRCGKPVNAHTKEESPC